MNLGFNLSAQIQFEEHIIVDNNTSIVATNTPKNSLALNVFPNPTTEVINIQTNFIIQQIEIYNSLGQLVLKNTNQESIDLSNLAQGMYFCKVKDSSGNFGIQKVVKE